MEKVWLKEYEKDVPATIDYPKVPVHRFLEDSAAKYPDKTALIFGNVVEPLGGRLMDATMSYGRLLELTRRFAAALQGLGVKKGDRVAVHLPNCPQFVIAYYATHMAKEKKEGHFQDLSGEANTHWFQELLAKAPSKPQPVEVTPEDTAVLMYTGGTTGVSKGAQLTQRNLVANTLQVRSWMPGLQVEKETTLTSLPLFHSFGMTVCMNVAMYLAGTMILIPNPRILEHTLKSINKHQPTLFPGVPALYVSLVNRPDIKEYNVSSIKACISGAAGLPAEVQEAFEKLTGGKLVEGYGLSEATPVTHCNPIFGKRKQGSWIGLPMPDTVATIVDLETGEKELGPGDIGELCIQGPQVMKGYWNMPTETANTLRDGWLHTGDIARMDTDGFFQIVDRKKDMILGAGGFNVYPRDVEEVLYEHPKIMEAVVAGIPVGIEKGERIKAYVVLKPGETATEEEIIDYCRKNLAPYKVPKFVEFRSDLPKTMVGKILRRVLIEEEIKRSQGQV
jgi:long-chain acyl-CoA synthetase